MGGSGKDSPIFVEPPLKFRSDPQFHKLMAMVASILFALHGPLKRLGRNRRGQDLLEYALIAGMIALGAGALMPGVATSISTIHSRISSQAVRIANQ